MRETLEPSAVWDRRLRYVPGGVLHPGGTQTIGGQRIERCCCVGGLAFVIAPIDSTSRADESNVSEEIKRSVTSAAAPLRLSQAEFTEQAAQNRRPRIKKEKSPLLRSCHGYFPGGVDHTPGNNPSRTKNLIDVLFWPGRPGCFSGGSDNVRGEYTRGGRKTGLGATLSESPRYFSRHN